MKAPVAIATLIVIAVACTGSASTTTSTSPIPATSTSTSAAATSTLPATTTTTTLTFPKYPPPEVEAPGGRWRTTQLSIDSAVVGFAELGGEAFMILQHPDDRVSTHRLAGEDWEAVRSEPVALADLKNISWGPMASNGQRILLVGNGREPGPTDGRRRRMTVIASTTDGDQYTTVTVPDAWFTDITTDGKTWFAIGNIYATGWEPAGAIWSSTDGESWVRSFGPSTTAVEWSFHSIAAGGGRVVATATQSQTQLYRANTMLSAETSGGNWHFTPIGDNNLPRALLYVADHFEVHTALGRGYRSADGVVWEPFVDDAAPPEETVVWGDWFEDHGSWVDPRGLHGEGAVLIKSGVSMHRTDWRYCYDDPTTCRQSFAAIWLRTDRVWWRVGLPIPGAIRSEDMGDGTNVASAEIVGGRIVIVGLSEVPEVPQEDHGYWIWLWVPDDGGALPPASDPLETSPPDSDLAPRPQYSPSYGGYIGILESGVEYALPITDSCSGLSHLGVFNEKFWVSDDMPETIPPEWPKRWVQTAPYNDWTWFGPLSGEGIVGYRALGIAVLVSDDLIEYRIPGLGVVGTFHPGLPSPPWPRC